MPDPERSLGATAHRQESERGREVVEGLTFWLSTLSRLFQGQFSTGGPDGVAGRGPSALMCAPLVNGTELERDKIR